MPDQNKLEKAARRQSVAGLGELTVTRREREASRRVTASVPSVKPSCFFFPYGELSDAWTRHLTPHWSAIGTATYVRPPRWGWQGTSKFATLVTSSQAV